MSNFNKNDPLIKKVQSALINYRFSVFYDFVKFVIPNYKSNLYNLLVVSRV